MENFELNKILRQPKKKTKKGIIDAIISFTFYFFILIFLNSERIS